MPGHTATQNLQTPTQNTTLHYELHKHTETAYLRVVLKILKGKLTLGYMWSGRKRIALVMLKCDTAINPEVASAYADSIAP